MSTNTPPKAKRLALIPICKQLTDLVSENKQYYLGQIIFAIDEVGRLGMKVGDWDWINTPPGSATNFVDLEWLIAPESAGSSGYTPFKVINDNTANGSANYQIVGNDAVITDPRFIGAADVLITSTKTGVPVKRAEMNLDNEAGVVTIYNYIGMNDDDHLAVEVPEVIKSADSVAALVDRIGKVENYTQAIAAGGVIFIWKKPANVIPSAFQEVIDLAGKTIVGRLDSDTDFTPVWTKTGGAKTHSIDTTDKLPKHWFYTVVDQIYSLDSHPGDVGRAISGIRSFLKFWNKPDAIGKESYELVGSDADGVAPTLSPTNSIGKPTPDPINHMNPYRIVNFIELRPEYVIS